MKYKITVDGEQFDVEVKQESGGGAEKKFRVDVAGKEYEITASRDGASASSAQSATTPSSSSSRRPNMSVTSSVPSMSRPAPSLSSSSGGGSAAATGTPIESPMAGKVVAINVKVGDVVKSGFVVAILEAMKMENAIIAPIDGKITAVAVEVGTVMKRGDVIVRIEG